MCFFFWNRCAIRNLHDTRFCYNNFVLNFSAKSECSDGFHHTHDWFFDEKTQQRWMFGQHPRNDFKWFYWKSRRHCPSTFRRYSPTTRYNCCEVRYVEPECQQQQLTTRHLGDAKARVATPLSAESFIWFHCHSDMLPINQMLWSDEELPGWNEVGNLLPQAAPALATPVELRSGHQFRNHQLRTSPSNCDRWEEKCVGGLHAKGILILRW